MEKNNYSQLQSIIGIFIKSIKNLQTNKRLIFSIAFFKLFLDVLMVLADILSIRPFLSDLFMNIFLLPTLDLTKNPSALIKSMLGIQKDISIVMCIQLIFGLTLFFTSLFYIIAMIYVSAMSNLGKSLTLEDVILRTKLTWKRQLVTNFYVSLFSMGCTLLILPLFFFTFLQYVDSSKLLLLFGVVLNFLISLLFIYLTAIGQLSLVVSVLEDVYGFQALGKAEKLIRGERVKGFVITLVNFLVIGVISLIPGYMVAEKPAITLVITIVISLVKIIISGLWGMFSMMVYTVFYFECKNSHGEEVEVGDEIYYTKVSTTPLVVDTALP